MEYVYIIESAQDPQRKYTGLTDNLERRLAEHNTGKSTHTNKFKPWRIRCYTAFKDKAQAEAFEQYLKSHSGRAFAKKHL